MEPATLDLPTGRIQVAIGTRFTVGTMFMGIDVAQLLDEQHENTRATHRLPLPNLH
jgi:hypothetical protein